MKPLQNTLNNNPESDFNTSETPKKEELSQEFKEKTSTDESDLMPEVNLEEKITAIQVVEEILEKTTSVKEADLKVENTKEDIPLTDSNTPSKNKTLDADLVLSILSYFVFPIAYFLKPTEDNQKLKKEVTSIFVIVVFGRLLDLFQSTLGIAIIDITFVVTLIALAYIIYGIYNIIKNNQVVTPLYNSLLKMINNFGLTNKVQDLRKKFNNNVKLDKKILASLIFIFLCILFAMTTVQSSYYYAIKAMSNGNVAEFKPVANYAKIHENSNSFKTTNRSDYDDYIDSYVEKRLPDVVEANLNQIKNNPLLVFNNDKILIEKEGPNYLVKHTIDQYRYSYNFSFNGFRWVITNLKMIF